MNTENCSQNYDIVFEHRFKDTICKHYHGDYGMLYSSFADNGVTIWQCACGYRIITNAAVNLSLKDTIQNSEI